MNRVWLTLAIVLLAGRFGVTQPVNDRPELAPLELKYAENLIYAAPVRLPPDSSLPATSLGLSELESLALSSHPRIAEAESLVSAARYECLQVGLPPNPTIGYSGSEIGDDGQAGQQGMYVGQQFVRGNKLGLNRAVAAKEVQRLEQVLAAERLRVLTDVRLKFYGAYLAQREVELTHRLAEISLEAAGTVEKLVEAKENRRTDLLQAEIEASRLAAAVLRAEAKHRAAWRELAAATGQTNLGILPLEAASAALEWNEAWEQSLDSLLASSPETAAAVAEIGRARCAVQRARVEPISDVTTQVGVQYDNASQDTIANVQIGLPLPIWNRNQGGIGKAQYELRAAQQRLRALELRLQQQLAEEFGRYEASRAQAQAYRQQILGRAEQNLGLVQEAFRAGEASYLELLTVQRTYFQISLDYLDTLREVNQSVQMLRGRLLAGQGN